MSRVNALILALFMPSLMSVAVMAETSNPPAQLGRLAALSGAVSYQGDAATPAETPAVNFPLTSGNRIVTPPRAHATVDIAAGRFFLDGDSAMSIGALAPGLSTVTLDRGAIILHVLPGGAGQVFVIETPRGALRADQPGYFEVEVAPDTGTVIASSLEGGAQFADATVLPPGTRTTVGKDQAPVMEAAVKDDFTRRIAAEVEDSRENAIEAPKYVSAQTTGFQTLQHHGLWALTERYGWVWEPQVMSDWAPFKDGRWVEIKPFGRTWIDTASWGFATSHYGHWVQVEDRWAWVPDNPVREPAIVSFGTKNPDGGDTVRWVPLGPEVASPAASTPVVINTVRVIRAQPPTVVNNTTVNTTTNVTTVGPSDDDDDPFFLVGPGFFPHPHPPFPEPRPVPNRNLTGLGAAGTPIQSGVGFPGRR